MGLTYSGISQRVWIGQVSKYQGRKKKYRKELNDQQTLDYTRQLGPGIILRTH